MKIAVIGSGISGLSCAYLLAREHSITVFEAEPEIGGHTATKDVEFNGRHYAIDTGFIVFNNWTYPNFIRLLDELGVASEPTEMSFSVSCRISGLEYSGSNLNTLFAQRRNLFNPSYYKMLWDILAFNKQVLNDLENQCIDPAISLGEYLSDKGYGKYFVEKYLIPMGSAIWSASSEAIENFPLLFFARFFKNHGLLSVNNRPQWRIITGGSREYLKPLEQSFTGKVLTNCPVQRITRLQHGVELTLPNGKIDRFDSVVLACHSDQALALISDPTSTEKELLSAIPYQSNEVVLHTDENFLPLKRRAWSSWNYHLKSQQQDRAILTYNMNILQRLNADKTFCVTLNASDDINPDKVIGRYQYSHPVFSLASVAASERWQEINGINNTWFCGAYWGNGFHEDGISSALKVANALGITW